MRSRALFTIFIVTAALSAACHGVDNEQSRCPQVAEHAEDPGVPIPLGGPPVLDWMDVIDPSARPPGKTCCATCGGDQAQAFWDLGQPEDCNARAKAFCERYFDRMSTAEWNFC